MTIITFLEQLANKPHYSMEYQELLHSQSESIKTSFVKKDQDLLKKEISTSNFFPVAIAVV